MGCAADAGGLRAPLAQADGQRVPGRLAQHDQGQEVVVPGGDDGEQQHRHDAGREQPQRDREEGAELARAVHPGRLEQLGRHGVDGVGPDQVEAERADQRGQDDRPGRVRQAELAEHQERRHGERGARDGDGAEHDGEDGAPAREVVLRHAVAGDRGEQGRPAGADDDVEQRVAEPLHEDAVAVGERVDDVLPEVELGAEPESERSRRGRLSPWSRSRRATTSGTIE